MKLKVPENVNSLIIEVIYFNSGVVNNGWRKNSYN